jgi:hypothetical protein
MNSETAADSLDSLDQTHSYPYWSESKESIKKQKTKRKDLKVCYKKISCSSPKKVSVCET